MYPLTRELVAQSMLGVFVRVATIKACIGSGNEMSRMGVIVQCVTVLEQFVRLILEIDIDEKSGGRRTAIETVEGIRAAIALSMSRIEASLRTFQSRESLKRVAKQRGIWALLECVRVHGKRLRRLYRVRHVLVHTVHAIRYTEAEAYALVEAIVHAVIAARPRYMAALLLVEGHVMSAAGRYADARRAYRGVLGVCGRLGAAGKREAWAQVCEGHALARLGRAREARARYKRACRSTPRTPWRTSRWATWRCGPAGTGRPLQCTGRQPGPTPAMSRPAFQGAMHWAWCGASGARRRP